MAPDYALELEMPARLVIIGDLNGQCDLLYRVLVGLKLIKKNGAWTGGRTILVQMGDIPNRGAKPREAMDLMVNLRPQALDAGGDVIWLLGNHEAMSVLGHEAYVTAEEYMEFASEEEMDQFHLERTRYIYELLGPPDISEVIPPIGGRLRAWEEEHAPGIATYRKEMGLDGRYGSYIRRTPVAFKIGKLLFVHGGLSPGWARHGLEGIARLLHEAWDEEPAYYQDLDPNGILRDPMGPLWHRAYCIANARPVRRDLSDALSAVNATQMVVGHTRTDAVENGKPSIPLVRQRGRLIMTDVGLGDQGEPGCVIVVEKGRFEAWTPGGSRSKIASVKER